jgi:uncharacterized protein (TIRG00374 family)
MQTNSQQNPLAGLVKKFIPGLVLAFAVLLIFGLVGDMREMLDTIKHFRWEIFPLVLLFTLFNYTIRFFKWHYYLGQIGVQNFPLLESARLFVAGFPLAMTPGKVGEVLKGVWVNQKTGVATARAVSVIVAERITDGLAVLLLSTLGVIAYPQYWPAFVIILVVLVAVIVISQIRPAAYWFLDLSEKIPLIKRFSTILREFYEGSFAVFRPGPTLLGVAMGMVSWIGEGVGFYYLLTALGLPAGKETFGNAVFILAFSTVIGAVSALPGGLGASEASIAGMLTLLVGVDSTTASVATLLIRLATLWFGVSLGVITWLFSWDLIAFIGKNKYEKLES